ncbi:MerC domain-containing protein [Cellulophaga baltica]|uniref:MerC domain-containing protein n=1 Tax=Cellulophaga TaxID=104264 RepID=UPI001C074A6D|nr:MULTISPECIES: MerC domain-containing protein [Cellulophaga]MBU2997527.1 MerC domain-containing protein [Cellulophaga baltica]MDO6768922.1 MerC domain-containing protein [Cellulophaga sp. 1_MG-2023]
MNLTIKKPDTWGALASTLCLIHCVATPFLFIAQSTATLAIANKPIWWGWIDIIFIVISFLAVYKSSQTTSSHFIKKALWISWIILFTTMVNEKLELFPIPEIVMYSVAVILAVLHIYNLNYCQCKTNKCCVNNE